MKQYNVIPAQSSLGVTVLKDFLSLEEAAWPNLLISLESFSHLTAFTVFSSSRFKSPVKDMTKLPSLLMLSVHITETKHQQYITHFT